VGVPKTLTDDEAWAKAVGNAMADGKLTSEKLAELTAEENKPDFSPLRSAVADGVRDGMKNGPNPSDVFGRIRVKAAGESYDATKSVGKHARTGLAVRDERGREVCLPSEFEYSKAGALLKWQAARSGVNVDLTERDRQLVGEMLEKDKWCGKIGSEWHTDIDGSRVKALLDDSTSGGQEVVPVWFDDAIIQFPLLHSELLPRVDLRDVPRGSSVEGASIGNPTLTWNVADGTAMTPFDTTSLTTAIDTTIFPVTVSVEVGLDFLSDSPADVGRILVENIGQRMLAELDKVIADGDGTTQPDGIFNAGSTNDIGNPAGGAGAAAQIDDYESLMFGIGKQYRHAAMQPAFIANDTTYQRTRSIAVGAADVRRVFGMDHNNYQLLGWSFLISNDLANDEAIFCAMKKYRLYRRQGQSVKWTSEGKELATKNLALLVVHGRYGGQVVDANAAAFRDNWEA